LKRTFFFALLLLTLAACRRNQETTIPTAVSIDDMATAMVLTQNAPPPGFNEYVSFPQIDAGLTDLPGWHYVVHLEFEGVFARTPRQTTASAQAEVWYNQLASSRRVVVQTSGELLGQQENVAYEAVRLGPDAFLVRDNVCLSNAGQDAVTAANLSAGQLVGGVSHAVPAAVKAVMNGQESWKYDFTTADLNLPAIQAQADGQITATSGELWVDPAHKAVVRFYVNLDVTNALIFDRTLPVSGQVIIRFDLDDIGAAYNISVPFGC